MDSNKIGIEILAQRFTLSVPQTKELELHLGANGIGGQWSPMRGVWRFPLLKLDQVADICEHFFGTEPWTSRSGALIEINLDTFVNEAGGELQHTVAAGELQTMLSAGGVIVARQNLQNDAAPQLSKGIVFERGGFDLTASDETGIRFTSGTTLSFLDMKMDVLRIICGEHYHQHPDQVSFGVIGYGDTEVSIDSNHKVEGDYAPAGSAVPSALAQAKPAKIDIELELGQKAKVEDVEKLLKGFRQLVQRGGLPSDLIRRALSDAGLDFV